MKKSFFFTCLLFFSVTHNIIHADTPYSKKQENSPKNSLDSSQKNETDNDAFEHFINLNNTSLKDPKVQKPTGRMRKMVRYYFQKIGISVLSCILSVKGFFVK